jgi:hypothetical protein
MHANTPDTINKYRTVGTFRFITRNVIYYCIYDSLTAKSKDNRKVSLAFFDYINNSIVSFLYIHYHYSIRSL